MTEKRFPAGAQPRVRLSRVSGDLSVEVWDEESILVKSDDNVRELYQEGDEVVVEGAEGDVELHVPAAVAITIGRCHGDARIEGVRSLAAERVDGSLEVEGVAESITIHRVSGDLEIDGLTGDTQIDSVDGDCELSADDSGAAVVLGDVAGDLESRGLSRLQIRQVGGDLRADGKLLEALGVGSVGGDLSCGPVRELRVGNIGGDLEVAGDHPIARTVAATAAAVREDDDSLRGFRKHQVPVDSERRNHR